MKRQAMQRILARHGIRTSYVRSRQGWRIREIGERVSVSADFDDESEASSAVDALQEALSAEGLKVERVNAFRIYVD